MGLPTAYYQLEGSKKAKAAVSPVRSKKKLEIKLKEFVESEEEEEMWVREIKQVKKEHREKREAKRKGETVRKKLTIARPPPTAGPSKLQAPTSTSVGKLTVVITKLPFIAPKPKEKTQVPPEAMAKTGKSEEEEGDEVETQESTPQTGPPLSLLQLEDHFFLPGRLDLEIMPWP
ncbi:hypothetical protein C0995_003444 [Termitomyces sp. Mi166|nr:hypothetical protein C0995_003444 [Termitomyces sp. Mi166\